MLISQPVNESHASSSLLESVNAALAVEDSATALRFCQDWLAVVPEDPDAQRYLGQSYARQGGGQERRLMGCLRHMWEGKVRGTR